MRGLITIFSIIIIISSILTSNAQDFIWVSSAGGTSDDIGRSIAADDNGNVFVTGNFEGDITLGAGEPNETTLSSLGEEDIYVAKYNSSGQLSWVKQISGPGTDIANSITINNAGNIFVVGLYEDSIIFGSGEINETLLLNTYPGSNHNYYNQFFVAKFNNNGELLWVKQTEGYGGQGFSVTVDSVGNCYAAGRSFNLGATFGAGEVNETDLPSYGKDQFFVAKYASNGQFAWVKSAAISWYSGGTEFDNKQSVGIAVDNNSNCYVTGTFNDTTTFGVGETTETTLGPTGWRDIFLAKYNSNGDFIWVKRAGGSSFSEGKAVSTDNQNNVYVTGFFVDSAMFGKGESNEIILESYSGYNIFLAKYNSNGLLQWVKQSGGGERHYGLDIVTDVLGYSYITGFFRDSTTFGAGEISETTLTSGLGSFCSSLFVAKYNANGDFEWANQSSNTCTESGAVDIDVNGNIYLTGWFYNTSYFDSISTISIGGRDLFIAKISGTINNIPAISTFSDIKLYPNPASRLFTLESPQYGKHINYIEIINLNGQIIFSKQTNGKSTEQIDLSSLTEGSYIVKIAGSNFIIAKKLVIH